MLRLTSILWPFQWFYTEELKEMNRLLCWDLHLENSVEVIEWLCEGHTDWWRTCRKLDVQYSRLEQTLEVPCNHELQVIGQVSPNWPLDTRDKGLIEVADDFDKKSGLIIPRTLVKVEDWQVMVTLSNFNDHPISVEEGTIVGALAPVEYVRRISSQIAATRQKKQVDDLPEYLRPLMDTEQLTEDQVSFF